MLRTQKHRQIRRLGEPNPMDDVPDQDSAQIPEKKVKTLFCLPEQSWEYERPISESDTDEKNMDGVLPS